MFGTTNRQTLQTKNGDYDLFDLLVARLIEGYAKPNSISDSLAVFSSESLHTDYLDADYRRHTTQPFSCSFVTPNSSDRRHFKLS